MMEKSAREWIEEGKSHPRSRKPPGSRGQLLQGSLAESVTTDSKVKQVPFHKSIK